MQSFHKVICFPAKNTVLFPDKKISGQKKIHTAKGCITPGREPAFPPCPGLPPHFSCPFGSSERIFSVNLHAKTRKTTIRYGQGNLLRHRRHAGFIPHARRPPVRPRRPERTARPGSENVHRHRTLEAADDGSGRRPGVRRLHHAQRGALLHRRQPRHL